MSAESRTTGTPRESSNTEGGQQRKQAKQGTSGATQYKKKKKLL